MKVLVSTPNRATACDNVRFALFVPFPFPFVFLFLFSGMGNVIYTRNWPHVALFYKPGRGIEQPIHLDIYRNTAR